MPKEKKKKKEKIPVHFMLHGERSSSSDKNSLFKEFTANGKHPLSILLSKKDGGPKEGDPFALISARSADGTKPLGGGTLLP